MSWMIDESDVGKTTVALSVGTPAASQLPGSLQLLVVPPSSQVWTAGTVRSSRSSTASRGRAAGRGRFRRGPNGAVVTLLSQRECEEDIPKLLARLVGRSPCRPATGSRR